MATVFVSPDWLDEHLHDVTVVDVRRSWDYDEGHLPGAISVPFDEFRDPTDANVGKLPTPENFGSLLGDAGIDRTDTIVAYDGDHGVYASRFLVTAEVFGHDPSNLFLLDGDYQAWARERETTTDVPDTSETAYRTGEIGGPIVDAAELEAAIETDAIVVDTRDPLEYDTVHVPGAVNFQWEWLVDDERRRLEPHEELRTVLGDHGIKPDRSVRLYCNTARRLSFVYAVCRELGYEDVAFYEGGIDAWADFGGPLETAD